MKVDLFSKVFLTLIALFLGIIALRPFFQPPTVSAQAGLSAVQFSGSLGGFWAFDTRTGEVWVYEGKKPPQFQGKISKLGTPLSLAK